MANQGVFNRDLKSVEKVNRSLQRLQHSVTFDARYGEIYPMFSEILYPHESITLKSTVYMRSIPMKTPQLSRVRIFTRYIAVPIRYMWSAWEEYINALNPIEVVPVEPHIANFNALGAPTGVVFDSDAKGRQLSLEPGSTLKSKADVLGVIPDLRDLSMTGIGQSKSFCRRIYERTLGASNTQLTGYQFFPHDLGDYLNAPVFIASLSSDVSSRFSAFKFAAYQLSFNFFYRRPNVEERVDDYYEIFHNYGDSFKPEYMPFFGLNSAGTSVDPFISDLILGKGYKDLNFSRLRLAAFGADNDSYMSTNYSLKTDSDSVARTSWKNCEKYVLRSGPNMNLMAKTFDIDGDCQYLESFIRLDRMRFAPWLMDRFTSANPWPQRGSEAQIPVSGNFSIPVTSSDQRFVLGSPSTSTTLAQGAYADISPSVWNQGSGTGILPAHYPFKAVGSAGSMSSGAFLYVSPSNFRFYMQLQHAKEMSGMTDGRYKSYLSMFYGSFLHNSQLEQPYFIGGFVQDLNVSEIQQTSETSTTPLGTVAGQGVSARRGATVRFSANEHTVVLGLMHIIPDAVYIGGLNRVDHTTDPFDWVLPQFAGLSEQPIRMSELCVKSTSLTETVRSDNDVAFGYEPRFNELRARHSYVTGAFRDVFNSTGSYQFYKPWLVTRNLAYSFTLRTNTIGEIRGLNVTSPVLSTEFLSTRHTMDYSNFEVTSTDVMYPFMVDVFHDEKIARIIPRRGIPRI